MRDPKEILAQAKLLYLEASTDLRDKLLTVGRLLHEFVYASLAQVAGLQEPARQKIGGTRRQAVRRAADEFGIHIDRIKEYIRAAMAADLLASETGIGDLAHGSIYHFGRFVTRRVGVRTVKPGRKETAAVTDSETWEVKPEFAESAKALFARAVQQGFTEAQSRREAVLLLRSKEAAAPVQKAKIVEDDASCELLEVPERYHQPVHSAVAACSAKDAAELLYQTILANGDPAAVAHHLSAMLQGRRFAEDVRAKRWGHKAEGRTSVAV